jgi:hypothetical protein
MLLKKVSKIQSGYINRGKIDPCDDGTCLLIQAKDVDADSLSYRTDALVRFMPRLSEKDWFIKSGDILFMARGARNFSVLMGDLPESVLAAACFFVVRTSNSEILPEYLCWYLNQSPVEEYLKRFSGRGVHMPVVRRAVLESIDIPLPPIKIQEQISEINNLLKKEQDLYKQLAEKRENLMTEICFRALRKSKQVRIAK